MIQDLRFGLKLLWKEKGFTLTALATLALCIGANTAIFTVLHAVLLAPLPFAEPQRLVTIGNIYPGAGITRSVQSSIPDYFDRRKLTDVFDAVALRTAAGYDAGGEGAPVRIDAEQVTPSYFDVLRVSPMMGRSLTETDAVFLKNQYVILSYGMWRDLYARDPQIIGKQIRLSGFAHQIVGVMPEGFTSPGSKAKLWVPLVWHPRANRRRSGRSPNKRPPCAYHLVPGCGYAISLSTCAKSVASE